MTPPWVVVGKIFLRWLIKPDKGHKGQGWKSMLRENVAVWSKTHLQVRIQELLRASRGNPGGWAHVLARGPLLDFCWRTGIQGYSGSMRLCWEGLNLGIKFFQILALGKRNTSWPLAKLCPSRTSFQACAHLFSEHPCSGSVHLLFGLTRFLCLLFWRSRGK